MSSTWINYFEGMITSVMDNVFDGKQCLQVDCSLLDLVRYLTEKDDSNLKK